MSVLDRTAHIKSRLSLFAAFVDCCLLAGCVVVEWDVVTKALKERYGVNCEKTEGAKK